MALFVLSICPFDISVGVGAYVIGLSQISSFLSLYYKVTFIYSDDTPVPFNFIFKFLTHCDNIRKLIDRKIQTIFNGSDTPAISNFISIVVNIIIPQTKGVSMTDIINMSHDNMCNNQGTSLAFQSNPEQQTFNLRQEC